MRYLLIAAFFPISTIIQAQKFGEKETIINKWTKATLNVLCYTKTERDNLLLLDSLLTTGQIDSIKHSFYINQIILSASSGTAIWFTYQKHNFLLSARHVFEDTTIGQGSCFNEIHIVENDTLNSIDLNSFELRPQRTIIGEIGSPSDIVFVNNTKLFTFSSKEDDMAVVNLDSSYYSYGLFKFLKKSGYEPVDIKEIDTLFRVKNREPVIAIGYPNESITKVKNLKELPTKFALFTSPFFTIPIVTNGTVFDNGDKTNTFEVNIFTYHGFSGGPIINSKGKLIGITHGYTSPKKTNSKGNYYEYHGEFKKTTLLMPLLHNLLRQIQSQQIQLEHF